MSTILVFMIMMTIATIWMLASVHENHQSFSQFLLSLPTQTDTKVTFKHKVKTAIPSYAYLKVAILSAKNLSALNLQGVKKSLKLELTFFQTETNIIYLQ